MNYLVSIITVCYNSERTISRTIESVMNQTYNNIEYIIIDGASTDGTLDVIAKYIEKYDNRMRVISEKDGGIYYAMNKGISLAKGAIIGIINSDDWYEPDAVETMVKRYNELIVKGKEYDLCIIYGSMRFCDIYGNELAIASSDHNKLREEMIFHPTCFISREVYSVYGKYNTKYVSAADYDYMLRAQEAGKVHFEFVNKIITNFTIGGMSASKEAYYDLLKVKKAHGIISPMRFFIEYFKCKLYDKMH